MKKLFILSTLVIFLWNCSGREFIKGDKKEFNGRIAWSADGNFNDEDDWASSPIALAIFAEAGVKDKLVHFEYNNIMPITDKQWEKHHEVSVLGAAERYGYRNSVFYNAQKDLDGAVNSIADAVNASSADNPLYFVLAGPMEIPVLGIQKSDPSKRKFVYCISHNAWNDGYMGYVERHLDGEVKEYNKRDVIKLGVNWIQIPNQDLLATSPRGSISFIEEEWEPWYWMRDSKDLKVQFLYERMRFLARADCTDAGMAYFLVTGDEEASISKLKRLLEDKAIPDPVEGRTVRMEAENFKSFRQFDVTREREASQRLAVIYSGDSDGEISTAFNEIHIPASSQYDVSVRFHPASDTAAEYRFYVNRELKGISSGSLKPDSWQTDHFRNISIKTGDEITIKVKSKEPDLRLDYVELTDRAQRNPFTRSISGPMDDPDALPGQIIVAGDPPGYLKYNGIEGPAFLCGPDNPETFVYDESRIYHTRRDSGQVEMIRVMEETGVNAFHFIMWKMQKSNMKGEGDDKHNPFIDNDPDKALDTAVLNRWDNWLGMFEQAGITVQLDFYDDATDVELIGWTLDEKGNLNPNEHRYITGIVERFKHHKNIIWGIEESLNKPPRSRVTHFKKIARVIAETDNHNHPIHAGFVVLNDPEGDDPENPATPDDYRDDPNIDIVSWLHIHNHGDDLEGQYQEYLKYYLRDSRDFIVMTNETFRHPTNGSSNSRKYVWACVMAGLHKLVPSHRPNNPKHKVHLYEDGFASSFMEQTDFHTMRPRNDLAAGSTKWVLANPAKSYILYTYDYTGDMGAMGIAKGTYDLLWLDTETGETVKERSRSFVKGGEVLWKKPATVSNEVALYLSKRY